MRFFLLRVIAFSFVATGLLTGCGGSTKKVEVSGKVTFPNSVKLTDTDSVAVEFLGEGKTEGATGSAKADGVFSAKVPPGKYKIAVIVQPYPGQKDSEKRSSDIANAIGKFDRKNSSLSYEVTGDEKQTVNIDLVKGTISK